MRKTRSKRKWFVVRCKGAQEASTQSRLDGQGYITYLPLLTIKRKGLEVVVPLFPCYLFVKFDPTKKSAAPIRSTKGALGLVKFGNIAAVVPDSIIEVLQESEDENGIQPALLKRYAIGDRVELLSGLLAGMLATISERDTGGRIVVLLELLSRFDRLSVNREAIAAR